jgi:hypothetical protein
MSKIVMKLFLSVVSLALFCFSGRAPAFAGNISFEFNTDGVLPSSQGAEYVAFTGTPETDVYSVSGGLLHENSTSIDFANSFYDANGVFNPRLDVCLEWSVKVTQNFASGVTMSLLGDAPNGPSWSFNLVPNAVQFFSNAANGYVNIISMDTTDAFHVYDLSIKGGGSAFQLFVDGALKFSGNGQQYFANNFSNPYDSFTWGDLGFDSSAIADWDFIRFTNPGICAATVPEPGGFTLQAAGIALSSLGLMFCRRRRSTG